MDSTLWRLIAQGDSEDEVPVILRLTQNSVPPDVRVVARFGDIATVRLKRSNILQMRESTEVLSAKGPIHLAPDEEIEEEITLDSAEAILPSDERRPPSLDVTGSGVVVGIVDWGFDFAHPDFRNHDGGTRILALWNQSPPRNPKSPEPYGYGIVYDSEMINQALKTDNPYAALGYHPASSDPDGSGTHGTHVSSIAVGNGSSEGPMGIAPEAALVFVQLSTWDTKGDEKIGDSVTLLEAVDFIVKKAGSRPCVINLSMGRHGGPHNGKTLVELAFDALLRAAPGRAICQSTGNYFNRRTHASGQIRPGEERILTWLVRPGDVTPNELEIWYSEKDVFIVEISSPDSKITKRAAQKERWAIGDEGKEIGQIYHRISEPNTLDNHVEIILNPDAPPGDWQVKIIGMDVIDGRFDAWIERDTRCPRCQSHFRNEDAVSFTTTGTICNGTRTIAVGAYNPHSPEKELGPFSSSGKTRDGRMKPDLVAPGVKILAARSAPRDKTFNVSLITRKSGTSMASPHVTGCVALMFEAAGRPLRIEETHNLLLSSADHIKESSEILDRFGSGYLNIEKAVNAAKELGAATSELQEIPMINETNNEEDSKEEISQVNEDFEIMDSSIEKVSEVFEELPEAVPPGALASMTVGGVQFEIRPISASPENNAANLDDALRYIISNSVVPAVVTGNILTSTSFQVFRWSSSVPMPSPMLPMADVETSSDIAAIIFSPEAIYFPSDPIISTRRWVIIPRLGEFYIGLSPKDQKACREGWIKKIANASREYSRSKLNILSMPALRLLLAHFASISIPVHGVNQPGKRFHGAIVSGVTSPLLKYPLSEPDCYLPVIAQAEGKLESINAYDLGAGISVGPIQFNVQRGALFRFLWSLWAKDRSLFDQELGIPLKWSMQVHESHYDILIDANTQQQVQLHGSSDAGEVDRNCGYFQSGFPGRSSFDKIDQAFRRKLASHLRNVIIWPHAQEMVIETSAWWLNSGLEIIHGEGIPKLDSLNPDRDVFILKSMLLSSYVRYSGYLKPILEAMNKWTSISEKLKNWELAIKAAVKKQGHLHVLMIRLRNQYKNAEDVYESIQRIRVQNNSSTSIAASTTTSSGNKSGEEQMEGSSLDSSSNPYDDVEIVERLDVPQTTDAEVDHEADSALEAIYISGQEASDESDSFGTTDIIDDISSNESILFDSDRPKDRPYPPFGTLSIKRTSGESRFNYKFTEEDALWTARFILGELNGRDDLEAHAVLWAKFNEYALLGHFKNPTFSNFLRHESFFLQPFIRDVMVAKRYMSQPDFIKTKGYYPRTNIPRGNLKKYLELQSTTWDRLPSACRSLASRALKGEILNPGINNSSYYISIRNHYFLKTGRYPNELEWKRFAERFAREQGLRWIGYISGLDQFNGVAFFTRVPAECLAKDYIWISTPSSLQYEGLEASSSKNIHEPDKIPTPTDSGTVRIAQMTLNALLGLHLATDGNLGPQTKGAIKRFQQRENLPISGQLDSVLMRSLLSKVASASDPNGKKCSTKEVIDRFEKGTDRPQDQKAADDLTRTIAKVALCVTKSQSTSTPIKKIKIVGHASTEGAKELNMELGIKRARRVAQLLAAAIRAIADNPVYIDPTSIPGGTNMASPQKISYI